MTQINDHSWEDGELLLLFSCKERHRRVLSDRVKTGVLLIIFFSDFCGLRRSSLREKRFVLAVQWDVVHHRGQDCPCMVGAGMHVTAACSHLSD